MITTPDAILKLSGQGVWRGLDKSNGVLMIGDQVPRITTSFQRIVLTPALAALGLDGVPFGNGLWYDDSKKAAEPAVVYAGVPTGPGAIPRFAGILKHEQGVQTGFPMNDAGAPYGTLLQPHMKGTLIKAGFVWYKTGLDSGGAAIDYSGVTRGMSLFAANDTGLPVFAEGLAADGIVLPDLSAAASVADLVSALTNLKLSSGGGNPSLADAAFVGRVVHLEPENGGILVSVGW
jgi:hypothetical protein